MPSPPTPTKSPSRLGLLLSALFLFALLMGPGPGMYLINDYAATGGRFLGMPALYAWTFFWLVVEAGIVSIAYLKIWKDGDQ